MEDKTCKRKHIVLRAMNTLLTIYFQLMIIKDVVGHVKENKTE
jgi:hypothetical protein